MTTPACSSAMAAAPSARAAAPGPRRLRAKDLPDGAREALGRMLSDETLRYGRIAEALAAEGFSIGAGAVGRYAAAQADDARREKAVIKQLNALDRWTRNHPGFDMAGTALSMLMTRLLSRLEGGDAPDDLPDEKAVTGLIQAAQAALQIEKLSGDRRRRDAIRAEVVAELRAALRSRPDLWAEIEALTAEPGGNGGEAP